MFEVQLLIWSDKRWGWVSKARRWERYWESIWLVTKGSRKWQSLEFSEQGNDGMELEYYPMDRVCDRLEREERSDRNYYQSEALS